MLYPLSKLGMLMHLFGLKRQRCVQRNSIPNSQHILEKVFTDMNSIGPMIAASAKLGLGYAERLLKDVRPEQFGAFARCSGAAVESNHPAFIYGHLSLYAPRIISELGGNLGTLEPSDTFNQLFSKDAKCIDDTDGTIYPSMDEILTAFRQGHEAAVKELEQAVDSIFLKDNPNDGMRKLFPTLGAMHAFYVGGHLMLHMGQMSAWRRVQGLGAA